MSLLITPQPDIVVRPLAQADIAPFWQLRLRALREHPRAFGPSYEEIRAVHERLSPPIALDIWTIDDVKDCGEDVILVAETGGALCGFIGLEWDRFEKSRHRATVRGTYVADEVQGRGIGKKLLGGLLDRARARPHVDTLKLEVTVGQDPAIALYESAGFVRYGVDREGLIVDGERVDVLLMSMRM
ncbi:MAG TPA: GNAT family N-acetyltransferase [Haliangium sp.]|nr:GNAT family N-acetyltransferase [Haliangium sp.]